MSMTRQEKRSFWQRAFWILRTSIITLLLIAILTGLAGGGFLLFNELQRSLNSVATRADVNEQKIELLRSDVDALMSENPEQQRQLNALQADVNRLRQELTTLQADLAADMEKQAEMLSTLAENVKTATEVQARLSEEADMLRDALLALQTDMNDVNGRIDSVGGEVDALQFALEEINKQVTDLETAVASEQLAQLDETLTLFRVWELITRARLRLAENNIGLATTDVRVAARSIDALLANMPTEQAEAFQTIQTRLELVLSELPDDPETAARDLESAWDALDSLLAQRVLPAGVT
ncbi:MAG: hypothetical protein D6706_06295, partial [Chloroflexi bacterium]